MIKKRGPERASTITGPSTHNQRIERLRRDAFDGVIGSIINYFHLWKKMLYWIHLMRLI